MARSLRAGDLAAVWVPDAEHEALRDLVRAREAAKAELTATTIVAEVGELSRFDRAARLMGYSGAVPSEHSSGA